MPTTRAPDTETEIGGARSNVGQVDDPFVVLRSEHTDLILDVAQGERPSILYWGPTLKTARPEELKRLAFRQWVHGGPSTDIAPSFSNELASGLSGPPGFVAHRDGADWAAQFHVTGVAREDTHRVAITCEDQNKSMRAVYEIALDRHSGVFSATTSITNLSDVSVSIEWCAPVCLPLEGRFTQLVTFMGRWAMEFQRQDTTIFRGSYLRENRSGRTGHDTFPGLIAMTDVTNETVGSAVGFHLGWSGNSRVRVDQHVDGRAFAQLGELFGPGEIVIASAETYTTPPLYAAFSDRGLNGLSQQFHAYVNDAILDGRGRGKPRLVHYNTWEAVYFNHSEERLLALAEKAASIGVERFVLDDGWFGARRHDGAGLGDWRVSDDAYPNGLGQLVEKVRMLGMEFGLWFEPEMVNRDSALFGAHPDWILEAPGVEQVPARNQLVLDLARSEVSEHLFESISTIVRAYDIDYIKWDMNRDIHHPGSAGRSAIHRQTHAVYALMRRLRNAFPDLEIETCASGGARADFGILRYADRIWTSDCNDALDRQSIQRGASYFFPLNVLGCHVGPAVCHTTSRTHQIAFRAATAIFGHMGLELDLMDQSDDDLDTLQRAINLYKEHRGLIHDSDLVRIDTSDDLNVLGVVAKNQDTAMFSCAKIKSCAATLPPRLCFIGLSPQKKYSVKIVWPTSSFSVTSPSIVETANLLDGSTFSGDALVQQGIQLPLMRPESCIIFYLKAVG